MVSFTVVILNAALAVIKASVCVCWGVGLLRKIKTNNKHKVV